MWDRHKGLKKSVKREGLSARCGSNKSNKNSWGPLEIYFLLHIMNGFRGPPATLGSPSKQMKKNICPRGCQPYK